MTRIAKLTLILFFVSATAYAQINMPAPSAKASVSTTVGLTDVTIDYFRPSVKGRQIFGEGDFLQPYGQLWRSGANQGTTVTFSTEVTIAGQKIDAGTYMILSTPGKDSWVFILYGDPSIGGNMSRVTDDQKVLVTTVDNMMLSQSVETLTFGISDISADNTTGHISFAWADHSYKVPFQVEYDDVVMKDIAAKTTVNPANYMAAANYYLSAGKDLNQALEWANMFLAIEGNERAFWHVHTKARILAALGNKKEAIETANKSIEIAKQNQGGDFGYIKRNEDLISSMK